MTDRLNLSKNPWISCRLQYLMPAPPRSYMSNSLLKLVRAVKKWPQSRAQPVARRLILLAWLSPFLVLLVVGVSQRPTEPGKVFSRRRSDGATNDKRRHSERCVS
jgi:hypothetical protein